MAEFIKNEDGAYVLDLNDLEKWVDKVDRRLDAIEKNNEPEVVFSVEKMRALGNDIGIFSGSYVDEKLYNKLEAKHEADCRLISEYDLEIKKLEKQNSDQNDTICKLYSDLCTEQKERIRCEAVIEDMKKENGSLRHSLNDYIGRSCNAEHYKKLYSDKSDDYDRLLEKQIKTEKDFTFYRNAYTDTISELEETNEKQHDFKEKYIKLAEQKDNYKDLFHSLNHKHQKVVGELNKLRESKTDLVNRNTYLIGLNKNLEDENETLKEKIHDAILHNKMRDDVYEKDIELKKAVEAKDIELKKAVEAKDREIDFLRAELDKYTSGSEEDCED